MYQRILDLSIIIGRKSVFLFGPRQTGKSTWLRQNIQTPYINLLLKKVFDDYLSNPNALESDLELHHRKSNSTILIIDEV